MVAAVLRYAVQRLGSRALQRNFTAAADNIPGLRTVRPTSASRSSTCYGAQNSSTKLHLVASMLVENLRRNLLLRKINNILQVPSKKRESKTEELFHLIAKMDRELPSHCGRDNRQLLMHLSILVQPKPDDPQWRFYRRAVTINRYAFYGFALSISYMAVSGEISQIYDALVE